MKKLQSYDLQYLLSKKAFTTYSNCSLSIYKSNNIYYVKDNFAPMYFTCDLQELNNFFETL